MKKNQNRKRKGDKMKNVNKKKMEEIKEKKNERKLLKELGYDFKGPESHSTTITTCKWQKRIMVLEYLALGKKIQ